MKTKILMLLVFMFFILPDFLHAKLLYTTDGEIILTGRLVKNKIKNTDPNRSKGDDWIRYNVLKLDKAINVVDSVDLKGPVKTVNEIHISPAGRELYEFLNTKIGRHATVTGKLYFNENMPDIRTDVLILAGAIVPDKFKADIYFFLFLVISVSASAGLFIVWFRFLKGK